MAEMCDELADTALLGKLRWFASETQGYTDSDVIAITLEQWRA